MTNSRWTSRIVRIMMMFVPGLAVMGSYCTLTDIRDNVISGGLSFVKGSISEVLYDLTGIKDVFNR
ncbi:MAG: hypothetical protein ACYTF1_15905 [Planctomycetota bacterium]